MVWQPTDTNDASTRRTYLQAAGTALGVAAFASGTAAASDDGCEYDVPEKPDDEFPGVSPLRVIDEPGEYELTTDLDVESGETGILIIADDVTLYGNEYTISGDGDGVGILVDDDRGGGASDVTITNIYLNNLSTGIDLFEPRRTTIYDVVVKHCDIGFVQDNDTASTVLRNNEFTASRVSLGVSTNTTLLNNTITEADDAGLTIADSGNNTIVDNYISQNDGPGILLESTGLERIALNEITDNAGAGIEFVNTSDSNVGRNTITDNGGAGVDLDGGSEDNLVLDNDLADNDEPCAVEDEASGNFFDGNSPACDD